MTSRQYAADLVKRVIDDHPEGITVQQLIEEVFNLAPTDDKPLYFGPESTLRDYLEELVSEGYLEMFPDSSGVFHVRPIGNRTEAVA